MTAPETGLRETDEYRFFRLRFLTREEIRIRLLLDGPLSNHTRLEYEELLGAVRKVIAAERADLTPHTPL